MREEIIYELKSIYREPMHVRAFRFGSGKDSVCIMGATRGNEMQPLYICSRLIRALREEERRHHFVKDRSVMVIPTINSYSMNVGKRFWPTDNTDINRMFPGYAEGETTQRIAAGIFERISRFEYGIQLASYYMPGYFIPHVRIMKTGYEEPDLARLFGLPYVMLRQPKPYNTATLNYNWQIWNTPAFSVYTCTADQIDEESADIGVKAVLNFLRAAGILRGEAEQGSDSRVVNYEALIAVSTSKAGLFRCLVDLNQEVHKGDVIASVLDPYTGEELERILAPADARVFFMHNQPLVYAYSVIFKLIPLDIPIKK
ncbi:MAG TPA: M14 family metallopeptidase [Lachnospiraceae bacterium]|nr:M14 family metallopeptidase [Lachnospiraceae bacterium]